MQVNKIDQLQDKVDKNIHDKEETIKDLIKKVLDKEEKKIYKSEKFKELGEKILKNLKAIKTDEVLKIITFESLDLGASDIHFEIKEYDVLVRLRIDGILVDTFNLEKKYYKSIVERLKYSSNLKLNITNIPQDGKYRYSTEERKIDVRVSTLPTSYGENIVCRILDASKTIIGFENLGFFWTSKRLIEKTIKKRFGMVLVTGPTGSGKTTTLYTMLSKLDSTEKKIMTLEDPIEYELSSITQSEINEKLGFTFESGLKALLRQDPDIIMIGEIRDFATLNIATNASLTGHLVISTLHTKSAGETFDRIRNMGLPSYVIASALDTIIAQRLVRRICPHCKEKIIKTDIERRLLKALMSELNMPKIQIENLAIYKGKGCQKCNHSGYKGRIGIYEILRINQEIKQIIRDGGSSEEILKEAKQSDMITLKEDGILKSIKGYTTIEEILRVI